MVRDSQRSALVTIAGISKSLGGREILHEISFSVDRSELVFVLGPSGSGKSTLLRTVAGLYEVDSGTILIDGEDASRWPPGRRSIGFVFQSYALFPHLSVEKNIRLGLPRHMKREDADRRVGELLELLGLREARNTRPAELSGGEQQRVALGRALAAQPRLLLLDEPFSALDAHVRERLRAELVSLQRSLGVATILVTHDQHDALAAADRIVVIDRGRVQQVGTPMEIYLTPVNEFVARFVGDGNSLLLPASVLARMDGQAGRRSPQGGAKQSGNALLRVFFRPESLDLGPVCDPATAVRGCVRALAFRGSTIRAQLELVDVAHPGLFVEAALTPATYASLQLTVGATVEVRLTSCVVW